MMQDESQVRKSFVLTAYGLIILSIENGTGTYQQSLDDIYSRQHF